MSTSSSARRTGSVTRLRLLLVILLLTLAIPMALLVFKARQQIKWEALYQQRTQAEELTQRIDLAISALIRRESTRPPADYRFFVEPADSSGYRQRSTLAQWPPAEAPAGLVGYFQVDAQGLLQTPLLPVPATAAGLTAGELTRRNARVSELHGILSSHQLVQQDATGRSGQADAAAFAVAPSAERSASAERAAPSSALDFQRNVERLSQQPRKGSEQKSLGKVAELQLEANAVAAAPPRQAASSARPQPLITQEKKQAVREERAALADALAPEADTAPADTTTPVRLFQHNVSPLELVRLDSGHLLFFRNVWHDGERLVQGFVLEQDAFFEHMVGDSFRLGTLAMVSNLVVAYRGDVIRIFSATPASERYDRIGLSTASDVRGTLLLQQRLSAPLGDLQLIYSVTQLPDGPGGTLISGISALLFVLLLVVFAVLHRLGIRQLRLAQQQQDFIASVSHELKTPLTSIRMFGEMLREGWVTPQKQKEYYDYICDESERLSRLIANVLQLARMERQSLQLELKPHSLATLCDLIRSRLGSQIERAGFELALTTPEETTPVQLTTDADALIQILLNLVDNAIKFSAKSAVKKIELAVTHDNREARFAVRDFGPGIPAGQQQKIFELFYRVGNELTRETQGTGIGLALVQQLARAMAGHIDVHNAQPGAVFTLHLPLANT